MPDITTNPGPCGPRRPTPPTGPACQQAGQARSRPRTGSSDPTRTGSRSHTVAGPRPGAGARAAVEALRELTDRDRYLLAVLAEHQVLTADQIARLKFTDANTARKRLVLLTRRGILDRFRDAVRPGSQPWRYTLGALGAAIVAAGRAQPAPRPAAHAERVLRLARSPRLGHLLGANEFFVALAQHARHDRAYALRWWLNETRATAACAGLARPDGLGVWAHHQPDGALREVAFFLEHDEGTEPIARLVAKLPGYAEAALGDGPDHPVLFWLPSTARETHLHAALARHPSPVRLATATRQHIDAAGLDPAGPVWLIPGHTTRRHLIDLAPDQRGASGPSGPGERAPDADWSDPDGRAA
jgi:Replication-relaxation